MGASVRGAALVILASAVLFGCRVEPRPRPDAGTPAPDAGRRDAGTPDSGIGECFLDPESCPAGQYCAPGYVCRPRPEACGTDGECAPGDRCLFEGVGGEGRCGAPTSACSAASPCPGARCLPAGFCAPAAEAVVLSGGEPRPAVLCADDTSCGPGGRCVEGVCGACVRDTQCAGGLVCADGRCAEPATCASAADCFPGHGCGPNRRCQRAAEGCTADRANDELEGATPLRFGHYQRLAICGDEVDHFQVAQRRSMGLRVALSWTAEEATLELVALDEAGELLAEATSLALPGIVVLELGFSELKPEETERAVILRVSSRDRSAAYDLDVREVPGLCAGDALDLYGDRTPEEALLAPSNETVVRRSCPNGVDHLRIAVEGGDRLDLEATWEGALMDLDLAVIGEDGRRLEATRADPESRAREGLTTAPLARSEVVTIESSSRFGGYVGVPYRLRLGRALDARSRACAAPLEIEGVSGEVTRTGGFAEAEDLGRPSCAEYAPAGRRDRLYRVEVGSAPSLLMASVRQRSGRGAELSLGLLERCADDSSVTACARGLVLRRRASLEQVLTSTAPVYLMVSSDGPEEALEFELTVEREPLTPPPPNDACAAAEPLEASGERLVSTFGASGFEQLETSGVCGFPGDGAGPERFYQLALAAGERAALELRGPTGGFLWSGRSCGLMSATCGAASEILDPTAPARISIQAGAAATYVIAVDGLEQADRGRWLLTTVRAPELECLGHAECTEGRRCDQYRCLLPPENDDCPGTLVTLDAAGAARIAGSTGAASPNHILACAPATDGSRDVVFRVELPEGVRALTARVAEADFDPVLAIRPGECRLGAGEVCNDDLAPGVTLLPQVRLEDPAPGAHYVVVDAYAGEGRFVLELETE